MPFVLRKVSTQRQLGSYRNVTLPVSRTYCWAISWKEIYFFSFCLCSQHHCQPAMMLLSPSSEEGESRLPAKSESLLFLLVKALLAALKRGVYTLNNKLGVREKGCLSNFIMCTCKGSSLHLLQDKAMLEMEVPSIKPIYNY